MTPAPSLTTRGWRRFSLADRKAVAWLIALPTILFVLPALVGHPAIVADNLIQNFPLRALAGRQLASGHLPLMNPYADSGTPLLGGLNAGALYPTTFFFLIPWAVAAWVANLIVVYASAAVGVYVLARTHGLAVRASFFGALSYAFFGAMTGQIVHLGVIQGYSLLPWAVLTLVTLSRRLQRAEARGGGFASACAAPLIAFAALWGLVCLSGEPRAIAVMELLTIVVAPAVLLLRSSYWLTTWRARIYFAATAALGVGWGVALGLVQLLPGWAFIGLSQRAKISYWFFGSGSLNVRWSGLLFVQDILGSNGVLGSPHYFVGYNLPEVTGYAGLLALVGLAAFVSSLTRRGWVGANREFSLYAVLAFIGLWATWGTYTWAGHLFRLIPLFGSTRLQSRNVILIDLAAAVLLAWWVDRLEAGDLQGAGLLGRRRWVSLSPALVVVVICVAMLGWGPSIVAHLGAAANVRHFARDEWLTLGLHLVIALSLVALAVTWTSRTKPLRWLGVVLVADLVVFLVFCSTGLVAGHTIQPSRAVATTALGDQGRTALVDVVGQHSYAFEALGEANMNAFTRLPSVQGYGSLIASAYDNETGTHPQEQLFPCEITRGTFRQLRLDALAVSSSLLVESPKTVNIAPQICLHQRPAASTRRYFGRMLNVASVYISGESGAPLASGLVTVSLLRASGEQFATQTLSAKASSGPVVVQWPSGVRAAGIEVSGSGVAVGNAVVTTADPIPANYQLNGKFEIALSSSAWRLVATPGTYSIFRATHLLPPDWLVNATAGQRVTHVRDASWGDSWVSVHAPRPVELVRSMAYLPGWRATAVNTRSGHSVELTVARHGLVQTVNVPAGTWVVHFHYHAPHIEAGVGVSLGALVAWLAAMGWLITGRRRRTTASIRS
jgi:hypothetical protein